MNTTLALIPAHNEAAGIEIAIRSLRLQTNPPDRIVVIADNCTDDTAAIAERCGAEMFVPTDNRHKKAGALNQALAALTFRNTDRVFIMDADSALSPVFLAAAHAAMDSDPDVTVGGVFYGDPGAGLVGALQRNEYWRYANDIYRKNDRAAVLTGTATMHRGRVLRQIAAERGHSLPGVNGDVYDTAVLTEDNEITLAIKTLGYRCVSPAGCRVHTEVMPTWRDLWHQRLRWQRGALENLRQYGASRVTAPYIVQQAAMVFGVAALFLYLTVTAWQVATHQISLSWLSALGLIFVAERVVTLRGRGWKHQVAAGGLIVEFMYDVFLQAVLIRSIFDMCTGREARWHHVTTGD